MAVQNPFDKPIFDIVEEFKQASARAEKSNTPSVLSGRRPRGYRPSPTRQFFKDRGMQASRLRPNQ